MAFSGRGMAWAAGIGFLGLVLAAEARAEEHLDSLTLTTGRIYHHVTIENADDTGIDILFKGGIAHIPFAILPPDLREKYTPAVSADAHLAPAPEPVPLTPAERAARLDHSLQAIRQTEVRRTFIVDRLGPGRFLASGNSIPSSPDETYREEPCVVTEADLSGLAPGRSWTGTVHRVGTEWVDGVSRVHYTADLREWTRKQKF
jgi:hypothetical protein